MNLIKNPLFYLCIVLVLVAGMMVIDFVKAGETDRSFEGPTMSFPDGLTSAPIDEGDGSQGKSWDSDERGIIGASKFVISDSEGNVNKDSLPRIEEGGLCLMIGQNDLGEPETYPQCFDSWDRIQTGSSPWTSGDNGLYYNRGSVGIGTINPQYQLDVDGDLNVRGSIYKDGEKFVGGSTEMNFEGLKIERVTKEVDGSSRAVASCPLDSVLIGGGCSQGDAGEGEVFVIRSEPGYGNSWYCETRKVGSGHLAAKATAICEVSNVDGADEESDPLYPEVGDYGFTNSQECVIPNGKDSKVKVTLGWNEGAYESKVEKMAQFYIGDALAWQDNWSDISPLSTNVSSVIDYNNPSRDDVSEKRKVRYRLKLCDSGGSCTDWSSVVEIELNRCLTIQ